MIDRDQFHLLRRSCLDCKKCALSAKPESRTFARTSLAGKTNLRAKILLIGEAPGAEEEAAGIPFIGKSGRLLQGAIKEAGIENNIIITNSVNCRPPENRTPTPDEIKACQPLLERKIDLFNPDKIVLLGSTAYQATKHLIDDTSIVKKETMGFLKTLSLSIKGIETLVFYHPAYILRKGYKSNEFQDYTNRFALL